MTFIKETSRYFLRLFSVLGDIVWLWSKRFVDRYFMQTPGEKHLKYEFPPFKSHFFYLFFFNYPEKVNIDSLWQNWKRNAENIRFSLEVLSGHFAAEMLLNFDDFYVILIRVVKITVEWM